MRIITGVTTQSDSVQSSDIVDYPIDRLKQIIEV